LAHLDLAIKAFIAIRDSNEDFFVNQRKHLDT